ncbi:MAG: hypothetical protein WCS37_15465 [Chloroflexota bacterium]
MYVEFAQLHLTPIRGAEAFQQLAALELALRNRATPASISWH